MVEGHRIERKIKVAEFLELIKDYSREYINCTNHTFFRLSEKQRKVFKCDKIRDYLLDETPHLTGIQYNGCYAVFYKYEKKKFIRVILGINLRKLEVVTFYVIEETQLPRLK